ncbi:hypothetical protein ES702_03251 [subsurface metagenome]
MRYRNLFAGLFLLGTIGFSLGISNTLSAEGSNDPYELSIDNVVVTSGESDVQSPSYPPDGEINATTRTTTSGNSEIYTETIGDAPGMDQYRWYNQDFGWTHTFDTMGKTIISAKLEIRAWDVDYASGERDIIYADGQRLGALTGSNGAWSTTPFTISPELATTLLEDGKLYIFMDIDSTHSRRYWAVTVDWSRLTVEYEELDYIKVFPDPAYVLVEKELQFVVKGYGFGENGVRDGDPDPEVYEPAGDDTGPVDIEATWTTSVPENVGAIDEKTGLFKAGKEVGQGKAKATYIQDEDELSDEVDVAVLEEDLKIFNGGSDLDNGDAPGLQPETPVKEEDEEDVGAFLLVNWDDDDGDGKMSNDGTWTKDPVPDLTENPVDKEDNLAKMIPSIIPILPKGGTVELNLVSGGKKIKLWSSKTKDAEVTLVSNKLSWDLEDAGQMEEFEKLGTDGLWIEGIDKSDEKQIKFTLKYVDPQGNIGDGDTVAATVVMINLGNAVHRLGGLRPYRDCGHAAMVYKFIGQCNKEDLSNDEKFHIIETGLLRVTGDCDLTGITRDHPWGCFTTKPVKYIDRLKVISAAKSLVGRPAWVGFRFALIPAKWNGKLSTIYRLRCDGLVEVCYEKNGIEVWGMERKPDNNKVHYDITDQTDDWTFHNFKWWQRSNKNPDNLEEHNQFSFSQLERVLVPATQCGHLKPVNAATKFIKQDLCVPIGSKGGN